MVDDNNTNRQIFQELLDSWGLSTRLCQSVDEAVETLQEAKAKREPFHLVLTDFQMPDKNGLDLIREIRELKFDLPIILLSSGIFSPEEDESIRPLARLEKPVRPDDLLLALGRALGLGTKSEKKARKPNETEPSLAPLQILLAEDVDVNQKVAMRMLSQLGHTVLLANNGEEALHLLETKKFDLILMDIQMPIMDGVTTTHIIREREKAGAPSTPIVAMTANAMKGDREKYLEAGMNSYISKPIRFTELAERLNEIIRRFNLGGFRAPPTETPET
jgi:CheY-like chemotaxis protein